jgi:peptidase A4-like protein
MFPENQYESHPAEASQTTPPPVHTPRRRGGGRLAATVISVALFGGLIGVAADRWAVNTFGPNPLNISIPTVTTGPRIGPIAAPDGSRTAQAAPTANTVTATDPTQQAIQQVIQKGDNEQAQAFASNDPSVMQDSSTSDFYQSQVSVNEDLRNNGVTDIKLLNIDWGDINVNGTQATATAWESWSTTYSDGTTEQSRDRNVYTLVHQNGNWVISADDHPDDNIGQGSPGASQPGATSPGQAQGNPGGAPGRGRGNPGGNPGGIPGGNSSPGGTQPRVPSQDVSRNWSGYAATGGSYTAVSGSWSVPQFAPNSQAGADATWVGIGGVNSRDLIQAGTQQTVSGSGSTQYQAWVETLPQASHPVPLAVNPGDSVSVSITQSPDAQDQWQVAFTNNTTGQTYQVTEHYTSSLSSAEWIEEAPSAARGRQLPLDNFGSITFSQGSTVKDGQTESIADAGARPITMVARGNGQTVRPSSLGADGGSFSVTQG